MTITGTLALESAILEKKSVIFGTSWFEGCPNIIQWKQGLSFEMILEKKVRPSSSILEFLLNKKDEFSIFGFQNNRAEERHNHYFNVANQKIQTDGVQELLETAFSEL